MDEKRKANNLNRYTRCKNTSTQKGRNILVCKKTTAEKIRRAVGVVSVKMNYAHRLRATYSKFKFSIQAPFQKCLYPFVFGGLALKHWICRGLLECNLYRLLCTLRLRCENIRLLCTRTSNERCRLCAPITAETQYEKYKFVVPKTLITFYYSYICRRKGVSENRARARCINNWFGNAKHLDKSS